MTTLIRPDDKKLSFFLGIAGSELTVAEVKELTKAIQFYCQADEYELVKTEDGLFMKFPVLGSDPEHYFDLLSITQDDGMNIVNLDKARQAIADGNPDMRECFADVWELICSSAK